MGGGRVYQVRIPRESGRLSPEADPRQDRHSSALSLDPSSIPDCERQASVMCGGCWSSPDTRFGDEPVGLFEKSDQMQSVSTLMEKKHYIVRSLESWMAFLKYARSFATFLAHGMAF